MCWLRERAGAGLTAKVYLLCERTGAGLNAKVYLLRERPGAGLNAKVRLLREQAEVLPWKSRLLAGRAGFVRLVHRAVSGPLLSATHKATPVAGRPPASTPLCGAVTCYRCFTDRRGASSPARSYLFATSLSLVLKSLRGSAFEQAV